MRGLLIALSLLAAASAVVYAQQVVAPLSPDVQALQAKLAEEINSNLVFRARLIQAQTRIEELQHAQNKAPEAAK